MSETDGDGRPVLAWRGVGRSVRGAAHGRAGRPNQDAFACHADGAAAVVAMAVADGHGSRKCFRSDAGARLAVEVASSFLLDFYTGFRKPAHPDARSAPETNWLATARQEAGESLPQAIVECWAERVRQDLVARPITDEEMSEVEAAAGLEARQAVERNALLPYGATLLAALAAPEFILYVQLGDGDFLAVSEEGEITRPLARDPRLIADETFSLCSARAHELMVVNFQLATGPVPALATLSTDGLSNAYRDEEGFRKLGSDILAAIREEGLEGVESHLEEWLTQASEGGSGDDVTLGLLVREGAGPRRPPGEAAAGNLPVEPMTEPALPCEEDNA